MVGAIADWFAVTALFKHPLGLPIPHTALIPKRKDELGAAWRSSWGRTSCRRRSSASGSARRRSRCGSAAGSPSPSNARRVVDEVAEVAAIALGRVRDEHVEALVRDALVPRFHEEPISPLLGRPARARRSATTCTTAWSTWRSTSCTAGWSPTPTPWPRCSASGRPGGRRPRLNERGHHPAPPRAGALGRRHPRRPAPPCPERARLACWPSSPQDLLHDPDTQERAERLKDRLLDHPSRVASGGLAVERAAPRAHRPPWPTPTAPSAPGCSPRPTASPTRLGEDAAPARAPRRPGRRRRRLRGRALRQRAHRGHHRARSTAGTARRPPAGSSCTSAATCSSSGSTAPSSAAWSACSSTPCPVLIG